MWWIFRTNPNFHLRKRNRAYICTPDNLSTWWRGVATLLPRNLQLQPFRGYAASINATAVISCNFVEAFNSVQRQTTASLRSSRTSQDNSILIFKTQTKIIVLHYFYSKSSFITFVTIQCYDFVNLAAKAGNETLREQVHWISVSCNFTISTVMIIKWTMYVWRRF